MIESIRKAILKDTGILIVPANTTAKKPPLPFGTVNLTSPWIDDKGHAEITTYKDDMGIHMLRSEAYQMVLSLQIYAASDMEAVQLARNVRNWFSLRGETLMEELNAVVVRKGNIENRTTFLIDSYDYKHGFDIQLRSTEGQVITNSVQQPGGPGSEDNGNGEGGNGSNPPVNYDWIETVEIEYEGVE